MKEHERKPIDISDGLSVSETRNGMAISIIPGDGDEPFGLDVLHGYDLWLSMVNPQDGLPIPLNGIRLRTQTGGGAFPFIFDEFSIVSESFLKYNGKIPPGYKGVVDRWQKTAGDYDIKTGIIKDNFPLHAQVTVETSQKKSEPRIKILGIPCDDDGKQSQMDIEVLQNGNVNLRLRGTDRIVFYETEEPEKEDFREGKMVFKTEENGGKFPIMAFVLTIIAQRMLKASKRTRHSR